MSTKIVFRWLYGLVWGCKDRTILKYHSYKCQRMSPPPTYASIPSQVQKSSKVLPHPCLKSTDEDDRVADSSSSQQEIFCPGNLWPLPLHPMAQLGIICFRNWTSKLSTATTDWNTLESNNRRSSGRVSILLIIPNQRKKGRISGRKTFISTEV